MNKKEIIQLRLFNQGILVEKFEKPADVVAHFGAMQAQDYPMALWAVGLRTENTNQSTVEHCINSGEIIRTHILRPTWHWVHQKDIRWMMELSSPYVKKATQYIDKKEGLTDELFRRTWKVIEHQFKEKDNLTKEDISTCLADHHIGVTNLLTTQIIIRAELEMLLCNGETKGSYALFERRVPSSQSISKTESITKLTHYYFRSRGPATLADFAWWSGLKMSDAKIGISGLGGQLGKFTYGGLDYYYFEIQEEISEYEASVLLPSYDEYAVSYSKSREVVLPDQIDRSKIGNGVFKPMILHKNTIAGIWARSNQNPFIETKSLKENEVFDERDIHQLIEPYLRFSALSHWNF